MPGKQSAKPDALAKEAVGVLAGLLGAQAGELEPDPKGGWLFTLSKSTSKSK